MILPDVNVLGYAHREDAPDHAAYRAWLEAVINSDRAFGLSDLVLSGFVRVVTHPRVFNPPSALDQALAFVADVREQPNCVPVNPGPRHWDIFTDLCRQHGPGAPRRRHLHGWFDAFRTLKFVHTVRDRGFPSRPWQDALRGAPHVRIPPSILGGDPEPIRAILARQEQELWR